jgi:glycosyltransferase involved in cell wall biosynthesis
VNIGCLLDCVSRNAGGLFESVRRLAQSFPQASGATTVFSLEDTNTAQDVAQWQPLSVRTFPASLGTWGYAPELFPALRDSNLDVLLTHGLWKYTSVASLAWSRHTGRPCIIHPHGMLDPWAVRNSKWKKRVAAALYENAHLRRAACLRALCDAEAQSIRALGLRNPICVIPNGVDLPDLSVARPALWRDERRESVTDPTGTRGALPSNLEGKKVLLYLGRLHPKKNLAALLQGWATLQREHQAAREWVLAIAGWDQGGYEGELERQCSRLNVQDSVRFVGPHFGEAKAACYLNCAAFVLPSLSEGVPMVVLEAWAYAKPVLMTAECNLPEGFTAGAALRISTDAAGIGAGLRALLEMSDAERAAMGVRGRALVAERFHWPDIGEDMRRVCEWTISGGAPPASVRMK